MKLAIVFGTRPEIIKLSHLVKLASESRDVVLEITHTGQHYSYNLSEQFLIDLGLPRIEEDIAVGSGERHEQVRKMVHGLTTVLERSRPDVVVVQGDTNSTLAGALASRALGIPSAHVEAGLRCYDPFMVEEMNRVEVDGISDLLFAPTAVSVENLEKEGVRGRVIEVGNTIVEVVRMGLEIAGRRSKILEELRLEPGSFVLVTAHRQENVDNRSRITNLMTAFENIEVPMIYPIHPRTLERVVEFGLLKRLQAIDNIRLTDPLSYFDFLKLASESRLIITDSGGIQEECSIFKKHVLIVRDNTERPEILGTFGELVGCDPEAILEAVGRVDRDYRTASERLKTLPSPYGDGRASELIFEELLDLYGSAGST